MTESHEPSYYEIALTNRQVLVAFVVLLGCLLAAFFSGVWIGRTGVRPGEVVEGEETPSGERLAEVPVEEFEFFSQETGALQQGSLEPPVARPRSETPLQEDPQGRRDSSLRDPSAESSGSPPGAPSPSSSATATPQVPIPSRVAPEELGAGADQGLVIQVFSSPSEEQAVKVLERLTSQGYRAYLSPVAVGSQTMYRVRIGPFAQREEAERVAQRVKTAFKLDTWITH